MSLDLVQDPAVREPRARLRTVLALLRILAGRRGHAGVAWHGAGFTYTLTAERDTPEANPAVADVDADPDTSGLLGADRTALVLRLRDLLEVHP